VIDDKSMSRKRLLDACDLLTALKPLVFPTLNPKPGQTSVDLSWDLAEEELFAAAAEYVKEHQ
jgi:hypothetical protein